MLWRLREKQVNGFSGVESVERKEEPKLEMPRIIPRYVRKRSSLIEGLDLQPIIRNIDNLQPKINNIENLQPIINKYGEKIMYIDENGKDTLDPPSGRIM